MTLHNDTIAAIATAPGQAGIAVVRLSGPEALTIADRIFRCPALSPSNRDAGTFTLGRVVHDGRVVDQALCLIMRAPRSYTGEDVVEFQGHGGGQCAKRILRAALDAGARQADPGEFTQRAFLNGRMDLVQAEAVLDLIHARSERAATAALEQLEGRLSRSLNECYDTLISLAADIEATLDFPEDELPETVLPNIIDRANTQLKALDAFIATWDEGHILREGALVVISGKPNVGKSTMLNALLGRERAIVSPIPGTTRDTIEESLVIEGIPLRMVDTAGLREAGDVIEQVGIERTRTEMGRADLHLHVIDATQPLDKDTEITLNQLPVGRTLVVINKSDLADTPFGISSPHPTLSISALQQGDIEKLKQFVYKMIANKLSLESRPHATVSERHRKLLCEARDELEQVIDMLTRESEDLVALASSRMRTALDTLGTITGRHYHDELLTQIFSRFCIGK